MYSYIRWAGMDPSVQCLVHTDSLTDNRLDITQMRKVNQVVRLYRKLYVFIPLYRNSNIITLCNKRLKHGYKHVP